MDAWIGQQQCDIERDGDCNHGKALSDGHLILEAKEHNDDGNRLPDDAKPADKDQCSKANTRTGGPAECQSQIRLKSENISGCF